jgi:acetyl/propionyl-CoA carboxylase alpha subunit
MRMKRSETPSVKPIKKLLIANRGEIACRIIAGCKKLGIKSVAVYSSADQGALHTQLADEALFIGEATPSKSYLNIDAVLVAAKKSNSDAIHPGYGFLSENPEFADSCEKLGVTFVGPSSEIISLMGNKIAAKELAQKSKVPLVAGISLSGESNTWSKQAEKFAAEVGYPLLVKASFGGGGRGMRIVASKADLIEALAGASREAKAFFGNGAVFLEKLLTNVRHVEVQVLGDQHGHLFTLFDRDCSLQRNHQKVIEEAPAPFIKPEVRKQIHSAAASLCQNAGYTNAGTVEFLLDEKGDFYFLEVNSRLQVEHPVTEAITGLDLVELQIRVAQGEDLSKSLKSLDESSICGHAIECRICAESPEDGFMPSSGKIELIDFPQIGSASSLRVDTGFIQGSSVSHYYDSLIAKVIVHSSSREAAVQDTIKVLQNSSIFGVKSNIAYLIDLLSSESFQKAKHHIKFAETILPSNEDQIEQSALVAALAALGELCPFDSLDAWQQNSSWRMFGPASLYRSYLTSGYQLNVSVTPGTHSQYKVLVKGLGDQEISFEFQNVGFSRSGLCCIVNGREQSVSYANAQGRTRWLRTDHGSYSYEKHQEILKRSSLSEAEHGGVISSALPGRIISVKVKEGDVVAEGTVLVVIESMKMEHPLTAPFDGKVTKVSVTAGGSVEAGATLVELAPTLKSA